MVPNAKRVLYEKTVVEKRDNEFSSDHHSANGIQLYTLKKSQLSLDCASPRLAAQKHICGIWRL